jgi:predicted transcriptional regulator
MEGLRSADAIQVVMVQPDANYRTTAAPRAEAGEHHPEMHMAMHHLREAKVEMERSAHDFAGHRVAALQNAESAIHEISEGLRGVGQTPAPVATPTPTPAPAMASYTVSAGALRGAAGEHHPEMRMAMNHLREAKRELERATHHYDGHRAAALKDVEASIEQIMEGLKADTAAPSPTPKPASTQAPTPGRRGAPGRGQ